MAVLLAIQKAREAKEKIKRQPMRKVGNMFRHRSNCRGFAEGTN